jgi:hypothetical protein
VLLVIDTQSWRSRAYLGGQSLSEGAVVGFPAYRPTPASSLNRLEIFPQADTCIDDLVITEADCVPIAEVAGNGWDDDCDGQIDE